MGIFLTYLENVAEFLVLLFSFLTLASKILAMSLLRLYIGEPLHNV